MLRFLSFLFIITCSFQALNAQEQAKLTLPAVLDSIEKIMTENDIPGLLLTMVTEDSVLYSNGLGMANLEESRSVDGTQLFRMGSITKTFAALAMLKLEAEGHFSLTDNLRDIAPEIPFKNKWAETNPVKIVHLLEHTAGFDDMHFKALYNLGERELPTIEMVNLHKESLISRWKPNTRMSYSNPGYVVLGYLIEKFSGKSYHDYIREEIFEPIGMRESNFASFPKEKEKYAQGYIHEGGQFSTVPFHAIQGGLAGTLNSCGEDMAKYIQFYLNDGVVDSTQLMPANWRKKMETPTSYLQAQRKIEGYALANTIFQLKAAFPFRGHNGGIDGFSSNFNYNADLGVGFAISNNANENTSAIEKIIVQFLTQDFIPPPLPSAQLEIEKIKPYLGYYAKKNPRNQLMYPITQYFEGFNLSLGADTLYATPFAADLDPLFPVGDLKFRGRIHNTPSIVLTEDEEGNKVYLERGDYFVKEHSTLIWVKRIWFIGSLIFSLTFAFFGLIWLIINFFSKKKSAATSAMTNLFIASLSLILMFIGFILVAENIRSAGQINWRTIFYFISSIIFAIGSIIGTIILFKNISNIDSIILKYYLLCVALSLVSLTAYFTWHDIVGLRFWAY